MKKTVRRKWRFTEVAVVVILLWAITVFERGIYFSFTTGHDSPWLYIFSAVGVLASSAFSIFVWKEKNENLPKILNNPDYDTERLAEQLRQDIEDEYRKLGGDKNGIY